jgi:predicted TIM-barrel fold metal-dependent hydrolase
MIYDAHAWIGHWPFRSLPERGADDLLRHMDWLGITKALVGNLNGLLYLDAHEANHELARDLRRRRDRLVPCATINPTYGGWREDLRQCREEFGMPVVRLLPDYHGYKLADRHAEELVRAALDLGMLPALFQRITDPRGRHPLDPGREAPDEEVLSLLGKFAGERFLLQNFRAIPGGKTPEKARWLLDTTRLMGRNGLMLDRLLREHGARRFALGTSMLLRYGSAPFLALDACRLTKAQRAAVTGGNLVRFLPTLQGG